MESDITLLRLPTSPHSRAPCLRAASFRAPCRGPAHHSSAHPQNPRPCLQPRRPSTSRLPHPCPMRPRRRHYQRSGCPRSRRPRPRRDPRSRDCLRWTPALPQGRGYRLLRRRGRQPDRPPTQLCAPPHHRDLPRRSHHAVRPSYHHPRHYLTFDLSLLRCSASKLGFILHARSFPGPTQRRRVPPLAALSLTTPMSRSRRASAALDPSRLSQQARPIQTTTASISAGASTVAIMCPGLARRASADCHSVPCPTEARPTHPTSAVPAAEQAHRAMHDPSAAPARITTA